MPAKRPRRTCVCGCGKSFAAKGKGRPRRYYSAACRYRVWGRINRPTKPELAKIATRPDILAMVNAYRAELKANRGKRVFLSDRKDA